jgi:hypothetical protein
VEREDEVSEKTAQPGLSLRFSDIPTFSYLHCSTPISQSPNALAAISTNPQQSSPQQAI